MRIRSIKPEFYTSEDIAALDWPTRLLFIGLWSYVDDNGVGRDVERLIVADLFPLEDDPRETLATVSRGLQTLFEQGLIARYHVHGKPYLQVTGWEKHQRIDKPNKARYEPVTCADAVIRDTLPTPSRDTRDTLAPGTGEQRNRGTGDQRNELANASSRVVASASPAAELAIFDEAPTAQTLVAEWIEHCTDRPPGRVVGQVAKELKTLLDEGIDPARVRAALAEWNRKGLHPSTLASVVHEITNRKPAARSQQATDDLFDRAMQRAIDAERNSA